VLVWRLQKLIICWLVAVIAVVLAFPAHSGLPSLQNRYFLVVWGYQGAGNPPRESHTFLTVYRGDDLAGGRVAPATISWFPATGVVHLVGIERGRIVSLRQTLAIACQGRKYVATWGPFEIPSALYRRALARIRFVRTAPRLDDVLGSSELAPSVDVKETPEPVRQGPWVSKTFLTGLISSLQNSTPHSLKQLPLKRKLD
jgi:hypothetical protein